MLDRFAQVWEALPVKESGLSAYDTVILASMVESEAKFDEERSTIASVYLNRMKKNMLMQCDATILYAMPERKTQLRFSDYKYESEYNTYCIRDCRLRPFPIQGRNLWRQPVSLTRQTIYIIFGIRQRIMVMYLRKPMKNICRIAISMDIKTGVGQV